MPPGSTPATVTTAISWTTGSCLKRHAALCTTSVFVHLLLWTVTTCPYGLSSCSASSVGPTVGREAYDGNFPLMSLS